MSNSSYSVDRDQEDRGSKTARENSLLDPIWKKPITKRADGVAQGVGPEFKLQYSKKTKQKQKNPVYLCLLTNTGEHKIQQM
jgi:hypothetical protein